MPLLAPDGRYSIGSPNKVNTPPRFYARGHMFTILIVVLRLEAPGAYPMQFGRLWLRTANIKQHSQRNMISFRRGKNKVRHRTEEHIPTAQNTTVPLYTEGVHMLDGLAKGENRSLVGGTSYHRTPL